MPVIKDRRCYTLGFLTRQGAIFENVKVNLVCISNIKIDNPIFAAINLQGV